jgi:hypothetical protein
MNARAFRVSEPKPPCYMMNASAAGRAADGAKHFAHNALDAGRRPWAKRRTTSTFSAGDRCQRRQIWRSISPKAAVSRRDFSRLSCPSGRR